MSQNHERARPDGKTADRPRRIAVYGPSGSGKSSLGREIGAALGLPVVELDSLFHRSNWQPTPEDEFRENVLSILAGHSDGWVVDGNYRAVGGDIVEMADQVVWLRLPFHVVYYRLWKRTLTRCIRKESLWGTNYESWRVSFLSRDSILLWGISHWRAHHRGIAHTLAEAPSPAPVITLRSQRQVENFLGSLRRKASAPTTA